MESTTGRKQRLSQNVQHIKPSGIRRFFDMASTMEDVISLGVGEPDFVTPWNVREASILSMERGYTAYTANAGMLDLRKEISRYLQERFETPYDPESEIVVTVGASEAIDIAVRAIVNPGEEVIIVEPSFVSYAPIVSLAGGVPVSVQTKKENGFKTDSFRTERSNYAENKGRNCLFSKQPDGNHFRRKGTAGAFHCY